MATTEIETRIIQLEETFSKRIAKLEEQVSQLTRQVNSTSASLEPWWKRIVGVYENDPEFDEAMRLGREYRESLRPQDDVAEQTGRSPPSLSSPMPRFSPVTAPTSPESPASTSRTGLSDGGLERRHQRDDHAYSALSTRCILHRSPALACAGASRSSRLPDGR
jgi:hypothetical protein